ncbi:MAG TPA: YceI family protein [Rhodanobacteraceae bacterium]|nr:YceI family protein [Rhodanobacteraceae bacterium]
MIRGRPALAISRRILSSWLLTLIALAGVEAHAEDGRYETVNLDSVRSHAEFSIKALWFFEVRGHFGKMKGTVRIDHFRSQAVVDAHIDVNAVRMSNRDYEQGVRSAEFFDATRYPDIHFLSESFPLVRLDKGGQLPGMLSMHGSSRPVDFLIDPATCAHPAIDCPLEASGSIRRSEFGMHSHRRTLGDQVELAFSIFVMPAPS